MQSTVQRINAWRVCYFRICQWQQLGSDSGIKSKDCTDKEESGHMDKPNTNVEGRRDKSSHLLSSPQLHCNLPPFLLQAASCDWSPVPFYHLTVVLSVPFRPKWSLHFLNCQFTWLHPIKPICEAKCQDSQREDDVNTQIRLHFWYPAHLSAAPNGIVRDFSELWIWKQCKTSRPSNRCDINSLVREKEIFLHTETKKNLWPHLCLFVTSIWIHLKMLWSATLRKIFVQETDHHVCIPELMQSSKFELPYLLSMSAILVLVSVHTFIDIWHGYFYCFCYFFPQLIFASTGGF